MAKLWLVYGGGWLLTMALVVYQLPVPMKMSVPMVSDKNQSPKLSMPFESPVVWLDRTLEKGLHFMHSQGGDSLAGSDEALGSGVCAADFDNDHWIDLFLVNGSGQTRHYGKRYWWQLGQGHALFHNDQGQGFSNVTAVSGLVQTSWGMGCLASDLDNDGDVDLLVTGRGVNSLYRNQGDGHFTEVTKLSGLKQGAWSTSAAVADINADGLLDLYIANFIDFNKGSKTFEANSQFDSLKQATFDANLYPAQANHFYLNRGNLTFQEVGDAYGVSDKTGRTLDVSWQDVNYDGHPDLMLANAPGSGSNMVYLNEEGQAFKPADQGLGWHSVSGLQGIASGDLDRDGRVDVIIGSPMTEKPLVLKMADSHGIKDIASNLGLAVDETQNLSMWSPVIQDFDNDADQDVFWASGLLEPDADSPKLSLGQSKRLFLNVGISQFVDVSARSGVALQDTQSARGVVAADFDNDGDIDLYVSHNNDPGQYLQNETPNQHWLGLKLIGKRSNRDAIGAEVALKTQNGVQVKVIQSGEGFLSDSDKRLVFGLGKQTEVNEINIHWPNGLQQHLSSLAIDRYWIIEEGGAPYALEVPTQTPNWALHLGVDDTTVRVAYLKLMTGELADANALKDLQLAADDVDAAVRLAAIEITTRFHSPAGLGILVHALDDSVTENVLAALVGLRNYEDETAVRWMLRQFVHADARVRIAVADNFAYFYREEEALIHRKYLAIPHLIRLLGDANAEVRIAAARALGAAERFRGVHALQDHLNDTDPLVRAEVISALGLIRQWPMAPQLTALLQDPSQPPEVMAQVLIALKRLGDEGVMQRVEACLSAGEGFETLTLQKRVAVLRQLLVLTQESSVFDVERLRQSAHRLLIETDDDVSSETVAIWSDIWTRLPDVRGQRWLETQMRSPQSMIRAYAYRALLKSDAQKIAWLAWSDSDLKIKQWALSLLLQKKVLLRDEDYRNILKQPTLRATALQILAQSDNAALKNPWIPALLPLSVQKAGQLSALESLCWTRDESLQSFCPLLVMAEATPLHRQIAARIVFDASLPLSLREVIVQQYDLVFDPQASDVLYGLALNKQDPIWRTVVEHLLSLGDVAMLGFAHQLAHDGTVSAGLRFQAIALLIRKGHAEARELLYQ